MLHVFERRLDQGLRASGVRPDVAAAIESQGTRLAAVTIPPAATSPERERARAAIHSAFVAGFRRVMFVAAALALLASATAWRLIDTKRRS